MSALLSAHQAAARCGVSERTVRRWIAAGLLDADKQGGTFRVSLEAVRTLAAARRGQDADDGQPADGTAAPVQEGPDSAAAGPDPLSQAEPGAGVPQAVADL